MTACSCPEPPAPRDDGCPLHGTDAVMAAIMGRALEARAGALAGRLERHDRRGEHLRDERDLLIAEMRTAGWGYRRIAAALRMGKARVQQIVTEGLGHPEAIPAAAGPRP